MRIRDPKTTALIFASGKLVRPLACRVVERSWIALVNSPLPALSALRQVCTGAKTEHMAKMASRKYARIIQKLGFPAQFKVGPPGRLW